MIEKARALSRESSVDLSYASDDHFFREPMGQNAIDIEEASLIYREISKTF